MKFPMPKSPNHDRIKRAKTAIRGYGGEDHDIEANIKDILADRSARPQC